MQDSRQATGFVLSLALHMLLVAAGVFGIGSSLKVDMSQPMQTVELLSVSPSEDPAAGDKGEPAAGPPLPPEEAVQAEAAKAKPEPKPADDAVKISEKKVEEKKKPEAKPDKKPTREELLRDALKDVKKDVADKAKDAKPKKSPVSDELAALRKSEGGNIFTPGGTGPGGAGGGKGTGAGGTGTGLMSVYGDIIKQIIKKNWRYPAFGAETNVAVVLEINIDQQGKITGSRVITPSGKPDFDDSALRAVAETQALPPPRTKTLDTLRITFNLQDLPK